MDIFFIFVVGVCFGSFYNVVGLRLLSKESIALSRSRCMNCQQELSFMDLVPVISFILLRGKCRYCQSKISPIYLLGEISAGVTFALLYSIFGFSIEFIIHLIMISMLIISMISDLSERRVVNIVVLVSLVSVFLLRLIIWDGFLYYFLSSIGLLFLFILLLFFCGEKIGGGDIKIYVVIGLASGAWFSVLSMFFACVIALLFVLPSILKKSVGLKHEIPFVPFIWGGVLITYFTNVSIMEWIGRWYFGG